MAPLAFSPRVAAQIPYLLIFTKVVTMDRQAEYYFDSWFSPKSSPLACTYQLWPSFSEH